MNKKKDLGRRVVWVCGACGKVIRAHTTTIHLATLQHRRMEKRKGNNLSGSESVTGTALTTDEEIREHVKKNQEKLYGESEINNE